MTAETNKQTKGIFKKLYEKIKKQDWYILVFGLLCVLGNASVQAVKKDPRTWIIISVGVFLVLYALIWFLSSIMGKERESTIQSILQEGGALDKYFQQKDEEFVTHIQQKIDGFNDHDTCLANIQNDCNKRIKQILLKPEYERIEFFDFDEILRKEKAIKDGEIWIVTEDVTTDLKNQDVYNVVGSNIKEGVKYTYFHDNTVKGANEATNVIEKDIAGQFNITDIEVKDKLRFISVSENFRALLAIAKDVIILEPNKENKIREVFLCIYASDNFKIAFYRKLNFKETNDLCDLIRKLLPKFS